MRYCVAFVVRNEMLQAMIIRKVSAVIFSKDEMFKDPGSLAAACRSRLWEIRQAKACYCVVADEGEGFSEHPLFSILIQLIFLCLNKDNTFLTVLSEDTPCWRMNTILPSCMKIKIRKTLRLCSKT